MAQYIGSLGRSIPPDHCRAAGIKGCHARRHQQHSASSMHDGFINNRQGLGDGIASARELADNQQVAQRRSIDECLDNGAIGGDPIPTDVILHQAPLDPLAHLIFVFADAFEYCSLCVDAAKRLKLDFRAMPDTQVLLHGHCHHKAFGGMKPLRKLLGLIPELRVEWVEASCCGMAGSFGYEAEHHELSMRMAELSLLPAVRAADADTLIVADGTSCRHQIADGTRAGGAGRKAVHAIHVLASALRAAIADPRPARRIGLRLPDPPDGPRGLNPGPSSP